ncbi:hypothetical protein [Glycomyces tenuis]|uniref:hypothetical protein n=1 Tax=Glycomyces tenuis TaxID=58116 RepID=UPI0003F5372E|nr:hypothetical protein [Glycomyces tenuis]
MNDFFAPFGRLRFWPAVGVLAAAVALWGLARISGVDLLLWQLALLALAALTVGAMLSALRPDTEPGPELTTQSVNSPTWRPFIEVNRWEDQLIFAEARRGPFEDGKVKQRLVQLTEERLRLRRGLSLHGDAEQCREILGDRTYAFLTEPVHDCPTEWELGEHLTRIEAV